MKKLVLTALTGLSAMLLLTGCEEEQTDTTLKRRNSQLYEFDIRKLVYKPNREALEQTVHWVKK